MHIIGTILVGFIAGVIAKFIHPGKENMGFILTTFLGIGGSLISTYAGQALGLYKAGEVAGFIGAVIGAIVILIVYGFIVGRTRS
jgi:uncharacterized membrane protein YeaQ/YmgE (transglycosylase-associated protein family)